MKVVVAPGEFVASDLPNNAEGVYKMPNGYYSKYLGIVCESEFGLRVVPLNGRYFPKAQDIIIGKVISNDNFSYGVDINAFKQVNLSKRNLESQLSVSDVVMLKVTDVNEVKDVSVEFVKKLYGGEIFEIGSKKSARVVGKAKSMLNLIEDTTKSKLTVGSNGYIYAVSGNMAVLSNILAKIEEYSHVDNLTEKMTVYLNANK